MASVEPSNFAVLSEKVQKLLKLVEKLKTENNRLAAELKSRPRHYDERKNEKRIADLEEEIRKFKKENKTLKEKEKLIKNKVERLSVKLDQIEI